MTQPSRAEKSASAAIAHAKAVLAALAQVQPRSTRHSSLAHALAKCIERDASGACTMRIVSEAAQALFNRELPEAFLALDGVDRLAVAQPRAEATPAGDALQVKLEMSPWGAEADDAALELGHSAVPSPTGVAKQAEAVGAMLALGLTDPLRFTGAAEEGGAALAHERAASTLRVGASEVVPPPAPTQSAAASQPTPRQGGAAAEPALTPTQSAAVSQPEQQSAPLHATYPRQLTAAENQYMQDELKKLCGSSEGGAFFNLVIDRHREDDGDRRIYCETVKNVLLMNPNYSLESDVINAYLRLLQYSAPPNTWCIATDFIALQGVVKMPLATRDPSFRVIFPLHVACGSERVNNHWTLGLLTFRDAECTNLQVTIFDSVSRANTMHFKEHKKGHTRTLTYNAILDWFKSTFPSWYDPHSTRTFVTTVAFAQQPTQGGFIMSSTCGFHICEFAKRLAMHKHFEIPDPQISPPLEKHIVRYRSRLVHELVTCRLLFE